MNEGAPVMYNEGGSGHDPKYRGSGQTKRQGQGRQYPLEMLQVMGGVVARSGGSSAGDVPRRHHARRRQPSAAGDTTAFGYDSDDSSLSSNASGSNKSVEKVDSAARNGCRGSGSGNQQHQQQQQGAAPAQTREWRGRQRQPPRQQHQHRQRRIAPDRYLNSTYPFHVKYTPDDLLNGSQWDPISQEIWDKFVKSQQTEATFRKKMNLWRYLYITIKSIFPRYGLYVVGSTMSGFGLDASDMDLCLCVRPLDHLEPRAHALLHLNYVLAYIKGFDPDAELIQAKVPILKFRDARSGLQVDLNCNNVVGIKNTNLLYCYSRLDWRVRPLVALTKLWARAHDINDARRRTLSSYALTLMVIHFLQCGTSPPVLPSACEAGMDAECGGGGGGWMRAPRPHNRTTLAELFLQLLRYYADFPYGKAAVSVRTGRAVCVSECRAARTINNDPHQWKLLCVEEPFDLTNTARTVYDPETFERIVNTFKESYRRLSTGMRLSDAWPSTTSSTTTATTTTTPNTSTATRAPR